jgi:thiamine-phosphate pyrophosphorylase
LAEQRRALVDQARAAAEAGVELFQVRERDLFDRDLLETVQPIVRAAEGSRLRVLVNDRPDVAIAAGAHGVHLRGDGIPVNDARTLLFNLIVGRSVHDVDEARHAAAAAASFVLFGTVFATASKAPGHPIAGIAALGAVVRACPAPVLAAVLLRGTEHNRALLLHGVAAQREQVLEDQVEPGGIGGAHAHLHARKIVHRAADVESEQLVLAAVLHHDVEVLRHQAGIDQVSFGDESAARFHGFGRLLRAARRAIDLLPSTA